MSWFHVALSVLLVVVFWTSDEQSLFVAARTGVITSYNCGPKQACFPWTGKPACNRGNHVNLRFMLDIAPEGEVCGYNLGPNTSNYVTYAFCPIVDELQAFNLSGSGALATMYSNNGNGSNVSNLQEAYLRVFGFGANDDILIPNITTSEGVVMIAGNCPTDPKKIAIVPFLILNVSMAAGKFVYYNNIPQPAGVGFAPSCATSNNLNYCTLDGSMPCIGLPGAMNCATCYDDTQSDLLANINIQVWTSYYGSDASGRVLTSGSNNPLNFRQYSGGSMYASLQGSIGGIQNGNFDVNPNDAGPPVGSGSGP